MFGPDHARQQRLDAGLGNLQACQRGVEVLIDHQLPGIELPLLPDTHARRSSLMVS